MYANKAPSEHMYAIDAFQVLNPYLLIQVLFKTRCDNRLAEITERASADKREVGDFLKSNFVDNLLN
jgi:hypothetical protein